MTPTEKIETISKNRIKWKPVFYDILCKRLKLQFGQSIPCHAVNKVKTAIKKKNMYQFDTNSTGIGLMPGGQS